MTEARRQIRVNGKKTAPPHELWEASSHNYLMHIMNETGGDGRMIRDEVLHPSMLKHLGSVSGKKVFDAGCGDGIIGRELTKQGAQVIGGDFVFDFASVAHTGSPPLSTIVSDVARLPIADESFDKLVSNLVLMWAPDIENSVKEFARILKHGARAAISITHPMVNLGEFDSSDKNHPKLILSESLQEGTYLKMINQTNGPYLYYQRPPATYVNTFTKNGFKLVEGSGYEDVFFSDDFLKKHPQYIRHKMFPLFLILSFDKV
ncbi:conserved hypothetical protein [Candidatus Roizmanbacteria bacterium]|nr:conserved hypothetical protein [Candidatus Roizmanbacteria bacterium]